MNSLPERSRDTGVMRVVVSSRAANVNGCGGEKNGQLDHHLWNASYGDRDRRSRCFGVCRCIQRFQGILAVQSKSMTAVERKGIRL